MRPCVPRCRFRGVSKAAGPIAHMDVGAEANSIYSCESDLQRYRVRFVPPQADEPHMLYDGDPAAVIAALEASRP